MSITDSRERLTWNDVWIWIRKYEKKILSKENFVIDELPFKINQHLNKLRTEISQIKPEHMNFKVNSVQPG